MEDYPCRTCGAATVGNRRASCRVCNRFAAKVRRRVEAILRTDHPDDAERARHRVVAELYPKIEWWP